MCKYKDWVVVWVLRCKKKPVLTKIAKYCLYEEPGQKKQDYKDRFRSRCLFSIKAPSQILESFYVLEFAYKFRILSALELVLWLIPV